jgi:perosamine synthetase
MRYPIKTFNTIGADERENVLRLLRDGASLPLSGYLAGKERGGYFVEKLENAWAEMFHVKHAIACNSATSGLMAAAFAIGLQQGHLFACPAMTMSATAAAPMFTGAVPWFFDVDEDDVSMASLVRYAPVFATNLFGHPAKLHNLREWCDHHCTHLIEDNAQAPFATENGKLTGTIGHIGVFSLNVHKPIQCGEGGMMTTDDDDLASKLRDFINHGENTGGPIGLNLRMPELCAAVALEQLRRGPEIIDGRIDQATAILKAIGPIDGLTRPMTREGCRHTFYAIPFLVEKNRDAFCNRLRDEGVPVVEGYVPPLYRLPAFAGYARLCPVAEDLHERRLFYIENCAFDFSPEQIEEIGAAFKKAAEVL